MSSQEVYVGAVMDTFEKVMRERIRREGRHGAFAFIPHMVAVLYERLREYPEGTQDSSAMIAMLTRWWDAMDLFMIKFSSAKLVRNIDWPLFYVVTENGKPCSRVVPEISDSEILIISDITWESTCSLVNHCIVNIKSYFFKK